MALPDIHLGMIGDEVDWRDPDLEDTSRDDDEELDVTPEDVVKLLGFDPLEYDLVKATNKQHSGVVIGYFLPKGAAKEVGSDEDAHLTVLYLGKELDEAQVESVKHIVKQCGKMYAPLQGKLGGVARFPASESSEGQDVLVRLVDVPRLELLRERLIEKLRAEGIEPVLGHGYTPHVTVRYVEPETDEELEPLELDLALNELTVTQGDRRFPYPVNGGEVIKFNPCHNSSDGKFCSTSGGGGGAVKAVLSEQLERDGNFPTGAVDKLAELPFDERIVSSRRVWKVSRERNPSSGYQLANGLYITDHREIILRSGPAGSSTVAIHEYGHHLDNQWYHSGTTPYYGETFGIDAAKFGSLRKGMIEEFRSATGRAGVRGSGSDWKKAYKQNMRKIGTPSAYALADSKEWFAESFTTYVKNPKLLKQRCPKTFEAVDGLVRGVFLTEAPNA